MSTSKGKYVVNEELTEEAHLSPELVRKCTFNIGAESPVQIRDDRDDQSNKNKTTRQFWQKFIDVTYPNHEKSTSVIIPDCVIHHDVHSYYGKPSVFVGIPQTWVKEMKLKLSTKGDAPIFGEKRIISDEKHWWLRHPFTEAEDGKEYIRTVDENGEDFYGSFTEFFGDYPTSVVANITGTLKLKTDTPMNEGLKGNEVWRAGMLFSMFNIIDATKVEAPSTGAGQRSIPGGKDKIRSGLLKAKRS